MMKRSLVLSVVSRTAGGSSRLVIMGMILLFFQFANQVTSNSL